MIASIDFHSDPLVPPQAVELEENILGAILLDPNAIAAVENLSIQAFSVSAHRKIFMVMLELHHSGLQLDSQQSQAEIREIYERIKRLLECQLDPIDEAQIEFLCRRPWFTPRQKQVLSAMEAVYDK